ncbi:MAG: SIS domain-containing protein, partial [Deferribacteraceae bacterium]|nr:SIS domain-containing protein [Deferribacteraceae bacterium]
MLRDILEQHRELFSRFIPRVAADIERAAQLVAKSFEGDGKLYLCGSGLSAHLARY